jgi:hypothetical protein
MNLDTSRLRAKIEKQIVRANDRIQEIQAEMQRLRTAEIPRMQQELATLEVVERIAGEYETLPEAGAVDSARCLEFSQNLVGPSLEKLSAEMGLEIPPPPPGPAPSPATQAEAAEQDQFFNQWH